MAENDLSTMEKICDAALALLRQDVGYADSTSVRAKCDNVWTLAYANLADAHEWSEAMDGGVPESPMLRHLLVYSLARELAIPVTGRQDDLKTADGMYAAKLKDAIAKDLEDETTALRGKTDEDSRFASEVLDLLRQYHAPQDGERGRQQTRGIAQMVSHIGSVKERLRLDTLSSFDWSFATEEMRAHSYSVPDGRYETPVPGGCVKVVKCYSGECEKAEAFIRHGDTLVTSVPLERIVYLRDRGGTKGWTAAAKRAYLWKVVQAVALSNAGGRSDIYRLSEIEKTAKDAEQRARTEDARQTHVGTSAYGRNYLFDVATGRRRAKWLGGRR